MFICIYFLFFYFGKIGKKLHTNRMRWVIGSVMLNVGMWVHVSKCKSFCGFHSFTRPFWLLGLDTLTWVYNSWMLEVAWTLWCGNRWFTSTPVKVHWNVELAFWALDGGKWFDNFFRKYILTKFLGLLPFISL